MHLFIDPMLPFADPDIGCTCFRLRKLTRAVSRLYDQHMATVGLKTTQYSLLKNIARQSRPVSELAELLATERTTLTRNLKPLIDAKWVALKPGVDSRQRIVTITSAGQAKIDAARSAWRLAQTELEDTLGIDAVRALTAMLDSTLVGITPLLKENTHVTTT
jgi:DNA-binding MarR family transcriptional regulator